jgi:ribosomal protein S8
MGNYKRYFAIEKEIRLTGAKINRKEIISQFTKNRTDSLKDLSNSEYDSFCRWLVLKYKRNKNWKDTPANKMRRKIFSLARESGMIWGDSAEDKKMNSAAIDVFLKSKGVVKKALNDLSHSELVKTVSQFEKMKENNELQAHRNQLKSLGARFGIEI